MNRDRLDDWRTELYALTLVSLVVIAAVDSWRTAALAGFAVGAVFLTRTRFALPSATAISFLAALFLISGPGVGG